MAGRALGCRSRLPTISRQKARPIRTRFAPSPTGPLHLGHAYSAMLAFDLAKAMGASFLLRIEDIDQSRARPEWESLIQEDLAWLGLSWPTPVLRQSEHLADYQSALEQLWHRGLLYPCTCKRRDILNAMSAPQEGAEPPMGPDGLIYPGICRPDHAPRGAFPSGAVLRLDMARALAQLGGGDIHFEETGLNAGEQRIGAADIVEQIGDIVLCRKDMGTSYHLSVVVDDAAQGITHVVRGEDLQSATFIHVVLQSLLDLPQPVYRHHRLIRDDSGKRLAKRDDAKAIRLYREAGHSPADVRHMVGL